MIQDAIGFLAVPAARVDAASASASIDAAEPHGADDSVATILSGATHHPGQGVLAAGAFVYGPCPMHVLDCPEGRLVAVNDAWLAYFGHVPSHVLGRTPDEIGLWRAVRSGLPEDGAGRESGIGAGSSRNEDICRVTVAGGGERDVLRTSKDCLIDDRPHQVVQLVDVTERRRSEEQARQRATHDVLTGLPNRLLLDDRLNTAIATAAREGRQVAVLFIDFDHFKRINDTLGHAVGDTLLREASQRLNRVIRRQDTLARIGGDEFVVLLNGLRAAVDAGHVAGKILQALAHPFVLEGHRVVANASIGISLFPGDAADAASLLRHADSAMYAAKSQGRRSWQFFSAETNERALARSRLESDLRRSVLRSEFVLLHEPVWDLQQDTLGGVVTSLAWKRGGAQRVASGEFMTVADEIGLGESIGQWMIDTAFAQVRLWASEARLAVPMCLGLTARQFDLPLVDGVRAALLRHAVEPRHIEFSVSEATLLIDLDRSRDIVSGLREQGCQVSVGDFGAGYSATRYLRDVPLTGVRLGSAWSRTMRDSRADQFILRTLIDLAHAMGLRVTAEGVADAAEADLLRALGVDAWSGALVAPPLLVEEFEARFDRTRTVVPFSVRRAGEAPLAR